MPSKQRVTEFIAQCERGQFVEALEEFYAADATMQENTDPPRLGLPALIENERTLGITPHQYVIRMRIEAAQRLLGEGRVSVTEAALQVGFATPSHLSRHMRRLLGAPPSAFIATGGGARGAGRKAP
jgi:hypothetical protein